MAPRLLLNSRYREKGQANEVRARSRLAADLYPKVAEAVRRFAPCFITKTLPAK